MRPRPSPQTPRWQGRAAAIDRRPWHRPLCASWLSPSKSSLTAFSVAAGPHHRSTGSESEQKSESSVAAGSRLSVVILPPALSMPAQPLRLSCLYHTPCDRVTAVIPQNAGCLRLLGSPGRFLQLVTGRHGHAKQVRRGAPRNFNPMWAPGLSDEARKAVNAAFDAMSTWRIE